MIGALILAISTFAVLNGLDGAQKTGRVNKERSVSATLAQQDIERLRSYPITALSNFSQTRNVNVAGVQYAVASETEWVRDASGVLNCTDDTAQADYLKISSTVRSPAQSAPVKEVSLLTPAAGAFNTTAGTLVVKITNRNGVALSGVSVSLSGPPPSRTRRTPRAARSSATSRPATTTSTCRGACPGAATTRPPRRRPWSPRRRA